MKKNIFSFNSLDKIKFYLSYVYYKLFAFREIKKGTLSIYTAELLWGMNQLFKTKFSMPKLFHKDYFETKFGKFYIEPDLVSTIAVSPAFEREDINYLCKQIKEKTKKGKKVLFIDIGANIGLYSVIIGRMFKKVDIIAFEPGTSYLSVPSYNLLKRNILINNIKNIRIYKIGIGSKNSKTKNKEGFLTKTLDTVIGKKFFQKYDSVFIKLDVDDFVLDALKGIVASVENGNDTTLLVEDFVDKRSITFLNKNYSFDRKLSTYNSFWKKS